MKTFGLISLLTLFMFGCVKPTYTGDCDRAVIESETGFNNGPFDATSSINSISWNGNCLEISVSYSGGCEDHEIDVVTNGALIKTQPPIMELALKHDNNDPCEALITETIAYDINDIVSLKNEDIVVLNFVKPAFSFTLEK